MSERSLIIVNFRSAGLTRQAVETARAASSVPLQVVVVDNSDDRAELRQLESAGADKILASPQNRGYAGGINLGLKECGGGVVVIANPDVVFRPHCLDRLGERLTGGVALSGPKLTWDESGEWLMPPAEQSTKFGKLSQAIATRSALWRLQRARTRLMARLRFWSLKSPARVEAISGAVMCVRRDVLDRIGQFDERFSLYFEEIDFMRRLQQAGWAIEYDPVAVCRHLYNQSAGQDPASAARFLASERAFHLKWDGEWFLHLTDRIASGEEKEEFESLSPDSAIQVGPDPGQFVVEASPLASFDVAVGHLPSEPQVFIPPEVWSDYRDPSLFLRVVDRATMRITARYRFDKATKMGPQ